jgi:hypothetical protein
MVRLFAVGLIEPLGHGFPEGFRGYGPKNVVEIEGIFWPVVFFGV